jgi:hypothetical protein
MKFKNLVILVYFLSFFVLYSCGENNPSPIKKQPFRTILIYMAANNNLSSEAYDNIDQLEDNIGDVDGNLLVYATLPGASPALYHITKKEGKKKIKEYAGHNSSDPSVLRQIINEVQQSYVAKSYGLILWSHATGWVPANIGPIKLKSFGNDGGDEMDIKELNNAIPSNVFDFVMFDACSMASVEVLYEIKDKANYFIASPGEVVANGMPYSKIVNDLFQEGTNAYVSISQKYLDHYNQMNGNYQSATVSLIDASKLQAIADATKQVLNAQSPIHDDFKRDQIQRMDFDRFSNPLIAFDFIDFIETNYNNANVASLKTAVNNAVLFKANTPKFNGFIINKNSGLTSYIPNIENENVAHDYYRSLKWYNSSGFNRLF